MPKFKRGDLVVIKRGVEAGYIFKVTEISSDLYDWLAYKDYRYESDPSKGGVIAVAERLLRKATKKEIKEYMVDQL